VRDYRVRIWLYAAALVTGGAFSILFTGETFDGDDAGFGRLSVVAIIAGYKAFLPFLLAAAVAVAVGSAGRYRLVLLVPAGAVYTVLAVYGMPPVFSPSKWKEFGFRIGNDVYWAANVLYAEPVPYDLAPGLFVVFIPVIMIVVAFATSATLYEGSPVVSVAVLGLTIGVLSTVSFEDGAGSFFAVFLASAVALLISAGAAGPDGPGRAVVVAGGAVVVVVLLVPKLPLSDTTVSPGLIDWTRIGTGGTSRLDVQADVGDYLTAGREAELLRVESEEPLLWRGGTMDYFDGVRWSDTTDPGAEDGEEISEDIDTRIVRQRVQVLNAETDLVFGGYKIGNVSAPGATPNSDGSWSLDEPFEEGSYYTVVSEIPQPTEAQLRSAGVDYPAPLRKKFLQLPEDNPPVVEETADRIVRSYDTDTPYDAARAVERYLIHDGGFFYNLDVSYRRADKAIEEFLGDGREGFCTQFSTSMALILREMEIPTRVVYGSTSGEVVDEDEYLVTGSNMHTWVEVYFPDVGWYPFNPTPGFSMPQAMEENAERPALPPGSPVTALGPENNAAQRQLAQETGEDAPQQQDLGTPEERANRSGEKGLPVWPFLVVVPVLLAAAVPLLKRALLTRGRPEDLYRDLTGRLRDVLPPGEAGSADSQALTPTERVMLLAGAAGVEEGPMREFARAYTDHLYSGRPAGVGVGRLSSAYRGALRAYRCLPRWKRALGALNPASLLARLTKVASDRKAGLGKVLRGRLRGVFGRRR
jgi:transglutaminase-like putative cysteine protease